MSTPGWAGVGGALLVAALYSLSAATSDGANRTESSGGARAAAVEIWRDSLSVPHIWAENEDDLAYALGYVHAQDRLGQMELSRRLGDGRLSEVLGPGALQSDRFLRTIGIGRAAAEEEATLDPETRRILEAYAAGVNRWIAQHPVDLPPELAALGVTPEPWTVRHSLAVGKLMAWDLADWESGLDLQRAVDAVGAAKASDLHPYYPAWGPTIVPGGAPAAESGEGSPVQRPGGVAIPRVPALAADLLAGASAASASNAWVLAGSRTRSGKPILANDPHLPLRAPSIWYLAALHGGATQAAGVTIPGLPTVVLGHTPSVAWGFTNAMVDDVDFFIERADPADSTRYLTPGGSEPFILREERINVRGAAAVDLRVRSTRHGPVVSSLNPRAGGRILAMQWTALIPSTSIRAMRQMNRARSAEQLISALRDFNEPHQNVVFADTSGRIGYWLAGRVPVRRSGDGLLPVPGWTGEGDWTGFLGFDRHPRLIEPPQGFIVTANEPQGGPGPRVGSSYAPPYRAMRIREMLADGRFSASDVARQQLDVVDVFARRYLPLALSAARSAGLPAAATSLAAWNAEARVDSHAAAIFYAWSAELRARIGTDEWGGAPAYFPSHALDRILDAGGGAWVDDVRTPLVEDLAQISEAAMRAAVARVGAATWGELHSTRIRHSLEGAGQPGPRSLDPFPSPGSSNTVNVAGYGGMPPFVNSYGASMRHVVDLGDPDGAGGLILPTGQSGDSRSSHSGDQTGRWRQNRLWLIPLGREAAARGVVSRFTLPPR